jgi:glycerol uptake facilitator-like aquaporin
MPVSNGARGALNLGTLVGESVGTFFLTLFGVAVWAAGAPFALASGFGFGFALIPLTWALWIRSGAHFNTGVTLARVAAWTAGLHQRDYFGRATLWWDIVAWFLYTGLQIASAVLLRQVDHSGFLAALPIGVPNGNLAGKQNDALLLTWVLNTALIWTYLQVMGPRVGPIIKTQTAPYVLGTMYFGVVVASVYWGTGSLCNFAIDLALSTLVPGHSSDKLWISAVMQIAGAATAFALYWFSAWLDRLLERKMESGEPDYDHQKLNAFREVMARFWTADAASAAPLLDPASSDGTLVAAHNTASRVHPGPHARHSHMTPPGVELRVHQHEI